MRLVKCADCGQIPSMITYDDGEILEIIIECDCNEMVERRSSPERMKTILRDDWDYVQKQKELDRYNQAMEFLGCTEMCCTMDELDRIISEIAAGVEETTVEYGNTMHEFPSEAVARLEVGEIIWDNRQGKSFEITEVMTESTYMGTDLSGSTYIIDTSKPELITIRNDNRFRETPRPLYHPLF